jgi:hypothetical protein
MLASLSELERHQPVLVPLLAHHKDRKKKVFLDENIPFGTTDIFYLYGIHTGYNWSDCENWLKNPKHYLVILEDDLDALYASFKVSKIQSLLRHPQVILRYIFDDEPFKELHELAWMFLNKSYSTYCSKTKEAKKAEEIISRIEWLSVWINYLAWGDLESNHVFFSNFFENLYTLGNAKDGSCLERSFSKVPAIVCGAGPSIEKDINYLKTLDNKALIMAGGSAINVLTAAGVQPHLTLGLDPTEEEVFRFQTNRSFEHPFFYRMRLFPRALDCIHARKVYLPGQGWYPIEKDVDEKYCQKILPLYEGVSVTCLACELAVHLGCDPIILLGCDLSYVEKKRYARGVGNIVDSQSSFEHVPWFHSVEREGKSSQWKWIIESKVLSHMVHGQKRHFINASELGLKIDNFENISLRDISFTKSFDLRGRLHSILEQASGVCINKQKAVDFLTTLKSSCDRCIHLIQEINEDLLLCLETGKSIETNPEIALKEYSLQEEVVYKGILASFCDTLDRKHQYSLQQIEKEKNLKLRACRKIHVRVNELLFLLGELEKLEQMIETTLCRQSKENSFGMSS